MVDVGLIAQQIYQDLQVDVGFASCYESVHRFVPKLKAEDPEIICRMECEPGEAVQIDYGEMYVLEDEKGRRMNAYFLRVLLSCSRKGYTEPSYRPNTEKMAHPTGVEPVTS